MQLGVSACNRRFVRTGAVLLYVITTPYPALGIPSGDPNVATPLSGHGYKPCMTVSFFKDTPSLYASIVKTRNIEGQKERIACIADVGRKKEERERER